MSLRPCKPGEEYHGPTRVPVTRVHRPRRRFWHLRTADINNDREHFQAMAEQRRAERKAQQENIRIFGPDISLEDDSADPLDSSCKVLKFIEVDDKVRLFYRRQERYFRLYFMKKK